MYNLVLFDLDGTLTDSKEGIINCVKFALESFGISENDEKILNSFIGPPLYDSFRREYGFSHSDALLAVKKYRERFEKTGIFENTIYDDTVTALTMLKNGGKKLALATSKPYVYAERILKNFKIFDFFDYRAGAEDDGTKGYKDEVIQKVLSLAHPCDLTKTVLIGDRENDILGAKKCNISSIGLRCGYANENELENAGADFIFNNLEEAANFILNN